MRPYMRGHILNFCVKGSRKATGSGDGQNLESNAGPRPRGIVTLSSLGTSRALGTHPSP
jgi:hypothetical protein